MKGKTTFDIEFNLIEQESVKSAFLKGSDLNKLNNFEDEFGKEFSLTQ